MDPGFLERVSYVKMCQMCVCVCVCVRACVRARVRVCVCVHVCGRFVCGYDFIYFFLKYPMKMKSFGVAETKLFHFHRIFKNGWGWVGDWTGWV